MSKGGCRERERERGLTICFGEFPLKGRGKASEETSARKLKNRNFTKHNRTCAKVNVLQSILI